MSDFIVRSFKENDIEALVSLFNTCFLPNGALIRDTDVFKWRYLMCPDFKEGDIKVVEYKGRIVSSATITFKEIFISGKEVYAGFIDDVMTHPDFRKKGLAKRVMKELENVALSNKADLMILYTGTTGVAHTLYQKLGFKDISTFSNCVKVLNIRKILKVKMNLAKIFGSYLLMRTFFSKIFGHLQKTSREGEVSIVPQSDLDKVINAYLNIINVFNKNNFEGYSEFTEERLRWMLHETRLTKNDIWQCTKNGEIGGLFIVSIHDGFFFSERFNTGILKIFYLDRGCSKRLIEEISEFYKGKLDLLLSVVPVHHSELNKLLREHKYTNLSKLTGTYAVMMIKTLRKEPARDIEKLKDKPWYPWLEHILGRP